MTYLILFVILISAKFCVSQDCSIISENGSIQLNLTDDRASSTVATFSKNKNVGEVLAVFELTNVTPTKLESPDVCKADYFKITVNETSNQLIFTIAEPFENFNSDMIDMTADSNPFDCEIDLYFDHDESCSGNFATRTRLKFLINDYNTYEPEFIGGPYNFQVDYPIANGAPITALTGIKIIARDIDYSTKVLSFEFIEDSQYFELKPGASSGRDFPVDIVAKGVLNLQHPVTLTLKATDDGQDPEPKSTTTVITISPGEKSTPPNPEFNEPYYQGEIDLETAKENDVVGSGIKLNEDYEGVNVYCEGSDYFKCEKDQNNIDVIVTLMKNPEEDFWSDGPVIVLTVKAEIENSMKPGIAPFVITLKNIPLATTTTESTITTESTDSTSTSTSSDDTETSTASTDPNSTTSTDDSETSTDPNSTTTSDDSETSTASTDPNSTTTSDDSETSTASTDPDSSTSSDDTHTPTDPNSTTSSDDTETSTDPNSSTSSDNTGTPSGPDDTGTPSDPNITDPPTQPTVTETSSPDNDTSTIAPPCKEDEEENADLIVVIIVLSIIVGVLLIALAVMYFKYVKGRGNDQDDQLLDSNSDNIETIGPAEMRLEERRKESVESETFSKPSNAWPENDDEIEIQNEIDRKPKGLDSLIAEKEENNLLKPDEVKSRKRSMTFSESDDESRQYRENLGKPVMTEIINENKRDPVRKKSVVTFKL